MPGNWVTKLLKNRAQILVRMLEMEVYRRCIRCAIDTVHRKHEDQQGNQHFFCNHCGQHN